MEKAVEGANVAGHGGPEMLNGATTRTVHVNVAAGRPELSCTVTLMLTLPAADDVPERVIAEPVVADGVNGPVTVQV